MQDAHDPYAALRSRDYRLLLLSNVLAATAAEAQFAAAEYELYERTQMAEYLGYGGLAQFVPVLLFALPAGQMADRFNRKYLLMTAHACMLLASLGLAAVSAFQAPDWMILLFLAVAGTGRALGMPTRTSLIPQVVPIEAIGNAVMWTSSGWQMARVSGSSLAGLLIASTEASAVVYQLTGLGLLVCIGIVALMQPRPMMTNPLTPDPSPPEGRGEKGAAPPSPPDGSEEKGEAPPSSSEARSLAGLLAGIRFVWRTELLFAAITLDLFAALLGGVSALLPIFASRDYLDVGPVGFGWLRAAESIGAFGMAMFLAHRAPMQRPGRALLWSVAGFGMATIVFGLSDNFALSFVALLLVGAFDNVSVVIRATLVQVLTPETMRGRVGAVNSVFISSTNQLGAFESGITAALYGPVASAVGGGVGTLLVVAFGALRWQSLRRLEPLHTLKAARQA